MSMQLMKQNSYANEKFREAHKLLKQNKRKSKRSTTEMTAEIGDVTSERETIRALVQTAQQHWKSKRVNVNNSVM